VLPAYWTPIGRMWSYLLQCEEVCGVFPSLTLFTTPTRPSRTCFSLHSGQTSLGRELLCWSPAGPARLQDCETCSELQQNSHQQRPSAIVNMLILKAGHRLARRVVPAIVRASHKACNVTPKSSKIRHVPSPLTISCTVSSHLNGISREVFVASHLYFNPFPRHFFPRSHSSTPPHIDNHVAPPEGCPLSRRLVPRWHLFHKQNQHSSLHYSGFRESQQAHPPRDAVHDPRPRQKAFSCVFDPIPGTTQGHVDRLLLRFDMGPRSKAHDGDELQTDSGWR
jgi:hypothetical protein